MEKLVGDRDSAANRPDKDSRAARHARERGVDGSMTRTFVTGSLAALLLAPMATSARADQGGVPFWFSGQFASLAAVSATPDWSLITSPYYYNGSANKSKTFQIGETVTAGAKTDAPLLIEQPGYASETKVLDGQPYVGLGWGVGANRTSVDLTLSNPDLAVGRGDSASGGLDLYPYSSLSWNKDNDNWMTYITGDIPTLAHTRRPVFPTSVSDTGRLMLVVVTPISTTKQDLSSRECWASRTTGRIRTPITRTESIHTLTGRSRSSSTTTGRSE